MQWLVVHSKIRLIFYSTDAMRKTHVAVCMLVRLPIFLIYLSHVAMQQYHIQDFNSKINSIESRKFNFKYIR